MYRLINVLLIDYLKHLTVISIFLLAIGADEQSHVKFCFVILFKYERHL
jgi:hypothetical protein